MVKSLTAYLETANSRPDGSQHGFRQGRSTVTNLLECDARIADFLNSNLPSDLITFDFSRAFHKVDHKTQCDKLKSAGIDDCYLRWIIDYLSNREQFINYKVFQSTTFAMPAGVVRRSRIGPSVFTIFINDLCKVVKYAKPSLFADDFKITCDVNTQRNCDFMQADVIAITDWSAANEPPIKFEKCSSPL